MKDAMILTCYAIAIAIVVPILAIAYVFTKGADQSEMNVDLDLGAE